MELPGILGKVLVLALVGQLVIPGHGGDEGFPVTARHPKPVCQRFNGIGTGQVVGRPLLGPGRAHGTHLLQTVLLGPPELMGDHVRPGWFHGGVIQGLVFQLLPPVGIPNGINGTFGLPCALETRTPVAHNALVGEALSVLVQAQERRAVHGAAVAAHAAPHTASGSRLHLAAGPQTHLDALALSSGRGIGVLLAVLCQSSVFAQQIHDHLLVSGKIACRQDYAVVCLEAEVFLLVVPANQGHHPASLVFFQVLAGDTEYKLSAHVLNHTMGVDDGLGHTQGSAGHFRRFAVLLFRLRRRSAEAILLVHAGRRPHHGPVKLGVLEDGGAHIVPEAVQFPLKVLGPGVHEGHHVLHFLRQRVNVPVEGGAGIVGELPHQGGVCPVQTPALPVGDDIHRVHLRCAPLLHKLRVH